MCIDDYMLIQSAFELKTTPKKDLAVSQVYRTQIIREKDRPVSVVQSTLFTITESSKPVAELLFRYLIQIKDDKSSTDEEIESFVFERMQYVYVTKVNDFLIPARLPPLYIDHVTSPTRSKSESLK